MDDGIIRVDEEFRIFVDVSSVPAKLNPSELTEFSDLLAAIKAKVSTEAQSHEVAVHEAGHVLQFALQEINRTNLYGPTIQYNPQLRNSRFRGFPAAVKETKDAEQVKNDKDGVKILTARCVSGGIATHIIFDRQFTDLEDEMGDDYDQFEKMCDLAESTQEPLKIDRSLLWRGTLKQVTTAYKSRPSIRSEIFTIAEEIKTGIHNWRGTPIPILCDLRAT